PRQPESLTGPVESIPEFSRNGELPLVGGGESRMVGARRCLVVLAATLLIVLTACTAPAEPQSTLLPTAPLPEPSFVEPPHGPSSVFIPRAEWDPDAEVLRVWAFVTALSEEGGECTLLAVA